jgi:LmbE family N-acetylglucosaminyl deacetylase
LSDTTDPNDPAGAPGSRPTTSVDLPTPASALAIIAHPDDAEFRCGATFAKWSAAGSVVSYLVLTDGSKGTWDVDADTAALVRLRQDEQRAAAAALGATGQVVFLGAVDGELDSTLERRSQVARVIRELRPAVVLGHDPWKRYRLHPDHRHAGWLAVDGVVAARDPHFFPEHGLAHHRPDALLLFEADEPDHVEDVTGFAEAKLAALFAHTSQFETTMHIGDDTEAAASETLIFRTRILDGLTAAGALGGVTHGESFKLITPL